MEFQIIALRDVKANCYKPPMFVPNINAAIRDLRDMINDPRGDQPQDWQRHPEDFELWHLGTWNQETTAFDLSKQTQLCALSTLKS